MDAIWPMNERMLHKFHFINIEEVKFMWHLFIHRSYYICQHMILIHECTNYEWINFAKFSLLNNEMLNLW